MKPLSLVLILALSSCSDGDDPRGVCGNDLMLGDPQFSLDTAASGTGVPVSLAVLAGTPGDECAVELELDCGNRLADVKRTFMPVRATAATGLVEASCADDFQQRNCAWESTVTHSDGRTTVRTGSTIFQCQP